MNVVDALARLATDAEPPPLDELTARRMIDRALLTRVIAAPPRSRWWLVPAFAVALAAAMMLGWWLKPVPAAELTRVTLATGDRLVGTAGAHFEVAHVEASDRRVALHDGMLLADVAHVVRGQRFAITTPHLTAIAKGTVFSVETDAVRSRVRVYEGIVDVVQHDEHHVVGPGTLWSSDAQLVITAQRPGVFAREIDDAIAQRTANRIEPQQPIDASRRLDNTNAVDKQAGDSDRSASDSATDKLAADKLASTDKLTATDRLAAADRLGTSDKPTATDKSATDKSTADKSASETSTSAKPASDKPATLATLDALLAQARAALTAGKLDDALAIATSAAARGGTDGAWLLVTADALRGLGRASEAADTYERAAKALYGTDRFEAAYSAAYLRLKELKDPDGALTVLVALRVDSADSPLEERGLVLHVRILDALKRAADAKPIAQRYLERYPHGELRAEMQQRAK